MPVIKSAKKALRRDRRRTVTNLKIKKSIKETVKKFRQKPTEAGLNTTYSILDTAVKKHYIHNNKASRLKSRLTSLITKSGEKKLKKPLKK